jgi:hypothetical protein
MVLRTKIKGKRGIAGIIGIAGIAGIIGITGIGQLFSGIKGGSMSKSACGISRKAKIVS